MKGDLGPAAKRFVGDITDKWKKVEVPLEEFAAQKLDLSKLNEIVFVFEQKIAAPATTGAIYLDDIALEK